MTIRWDNGNLLSGTGLFKQYDKDNAELMCTKCNNKLFLIYMTEDGDIFVKCKICGKNNTISYI